MTDWSYYEQTVDVGYSGNFEGSRGAYQDLDLRINPTANPHPLSLYRINWDASPPTRTLLDTDSYTDSGTLGQVVLLSLNNGKFLAVSAKATSSTVSTGYGRVINTAGGVLSIGPEFVLNASTAVGYNYPYVWVADASTVITIPNIIGMGRWFTSTFTDTSATEVAEVSLVVSPERRFWVHAVTLGRAVVDTYTTGSGSNDPHLQLRTVNGAILQDVDLDPTTTLPTVSLTSWQGHAAAHGGVDALGRAVIPIQNRNSPSNTVASAEVRIYDVSADTLNLVGTIPVASTTGTGVIIDFTRLMRLGTTGSRFLGATRGSVVSLFIVDTEAMTVEAVPMPPGVTDLYEILTFDEESFFVEFNTGEFLYHAAPVAPGRLKVWSDADGEWLWQGYGSISGATGVGRFRVWDGSSWRFAEPVAGEGGTGRLKVWDGTAWKVTVP